MKRGEPKKYSLTILNDIMNHKQKRRLLGIIIILLLSSGACGLILFSLKQNINLFYTPTQLLQTTINPEKTLRMGGYVKDNSLQYDSSGERVNFVITDRVHEIRVNYQGILPNLFREGQAVVVTGKINGEHVLLANQVLAKHDEKYVPPQLKKALKKEA